MKQIGFIPLRKGSKGIPNKNKRKMVGRPLFTWVLGEAIFSNLDEVIIYTDDETIIDFIKKKNFSIDIQIIEDGKAMILQLQICLIIHGVYIFIYMIRSKLVAHLVLQILIGIQ